MKLGTIEGEVDTSKFKFRATEEVGKFDFVSVKSNNKWILAQVETVTKQPEGKTIAEASIIGYRDKGLTKAPRQVIEPDSIVYEADQELISETLGLEEEGLVIGNLETNPDIDIHVNAEDLYKHFAVLAQTGAGKSYLSGVLIEEMLEKNFPVMILDPHGEYSSLSESNPEREDGEGFEVNEYSPNTNVNSNAIPLKFSSLNMSKKEMLEVIPDSLTNSQMGVLYNSLKRLREKEEDYNLNDVLEAISHEDSTAKWNLLNSLEQVQEYDIFEEEGVDLENLLEKGEATIINLKAVETDATEITAYLIAKRMFRLRKKDRIPPFIMLMEEAHNFAPEQSFGKAVSSDILRKIASEGRKFGLGIGVISQRPARIDKNVLSQCNTQFILRISNPNDLKAVSKSFEGVTSEVESMIKSLPPGVCFVLGNEYPVMTEVRQRMSKHGGETQTAEDYEEKKEIEYFRPAVDVEEMDVEEGEKYSVSYYPLYLLESDKKELVVDGRSGEINAERQKLSGTEKQVYEKISKGMSKSEVVEETDVSLTKFSSVIDQLRQKGALENDSMEARETILSVEIEKGEVPEGELIEYEIDEDEALRKLEGEQVSKIYHPYYSKGEMVFDPVSQEEVS